jgi:hypothetical protein
MSGFGKHDKDIHNQEIQDATDTLLNKYIPKFAASLDLLDKKKLKLLTELMHREGINMRHMVRRSMVVTDVTRGESARVFRMQW